MARESFKELSVFQQIPQSATDVIPYIRFSHPNLVFKLRPATQNTDNVFQIATHYMVFVATLVKGSKFGRKKMRGMNQPDAGTAW